MKYVSKPMEITEVKVDQFGSFIRFIDEDGEEGFLLIPAISGCFDGKYSKSIIITVDEVTGG
jgi:hypothetical protein